MERTLQGKIFVTVYWLSVNEISNDLQRVKVNLKYTWLNNLNSDVKGSEHLFRI